MKKGFLLLVILGALAPLPPLVAASHCTTLGENFIQIKPFQICDSNSDRLPDTVRFALPASGTSAQVTFYEERFGDDARIVGFYSFNAGMRLSPGLYGHISARDGSERQGYEDIDLWGGTYFGGSGLPRAVYFLALDDDDKNQFPERRDLLLCSTETGCVLLV